MANSTSIESILLSSMIGIWEDFLARLPFILTAVIILLLTSLVVYLVTKSVDKVLIRSRMRASLRELLLRLVTILIWMLGLLLAAMIIFPGLTPSKALGGLGLVSIAVGFAFKDIFENFFAGILLLWRFPMEAGDYIECEGVNGQIDKITVRMTTIRAVTDELIVVPNSFLFKNPLTIITYHEKRRAGIVVGIAYGENVADALVVIEDAVTKCETVAKNKSVQVFPQGFNSSSLDIEVVWWTDPSPLDLRRSRGEVVMAIKEALDNNGIEIPYPYRMLTFKDGLEVRHGESKTTD